MGRNRNDDIQPFDGYPASDNHAGDQPDHVNLGSCHDYHCWQYYDNSPSATIWLLGNQMGGDGRRLTDW